MSPKRSVSAAFLAARIAEQHKRFKIAIEEAADEYTCPITHALPAHPVMAKDGQFYERDAIEEWIEKCKKEERDLNSPVTNEEMGDRLTPAVRVKSSLKRMVESGAIGGEKAAAWLARARRSRRSRRCGGRRSAATRGR